MYLIIKRVLDVLLAMFLLIFLFPVFILTALLIWIIMGYPVFFVQKRLGKNNKVFYAYKFRSMKNKTQELTSDKSRMTPFGNFIRSSRIDEFPQIINILKGDMSFIGPRPLLPEYLPYYSLEEQKRHLVRPGLSGLSQINSLNYPDWSVQLGDDVKYVQDISFKLDLFILAKTVQRMFQAEKLAQSNTKQRINFIEYKTSLNQSKE